MLNQGIYQKHIRELELKEFPELKESGGFPDKIQHNNWIVYPPHHHFSPENPLLTKEIVEDLIANNKRLLSVGCGPSYLERLLVQRLNVKQENIVLADKIKKNIPLGFKFYRFNAYKKWPTFTNLFDYIIFPESACLYLKPNKTKVKNVLQNLLISSIEALNPQGEARMTGMFPPEEKISDIKKKLLKRYQGIKVIRHNCSFLTITKEKEFKN